MYLQIKKIESVPDKYGSHIKITMIGLHDESGKWLKWVKLDNDLINKLSTSKIELIK